MINGQKRWLFFVMDNATRTILAYKVSKRKSGVRAQSLFRAAYNFSRRPPQILVSDGLKSFTRAADSVFADARSRTFVHIREIHLRLQYNNNNIQERYLSYKTRKCKSRSKSKNSDKQKIKLRHAPVHDYDLPIC